MHRVGYNSHVDKKQSRSGVILMVTLVLLVVLSMISYSLTVRIMGQRHRNQYIIDYSKARYGCDSAVKYAIASLGDLEMELIERPNEPDFSDLFSLDDQAYKEFIAPWQTAVEVKGVPMSSPIQSANSVDSNAVPFSFTKADGSAGDKVEVPGPYGSEWPLVTEPMEVTIGSATVRIEIEDENAKYPLVWAILDDREVQREAKAGFETFCEWMKLDSGEIESLKKQLKEIESIKPFKFDLKEVTVTDKNASKVSRRRRGRRKTRRRGTKKTRKIPSTIHTADFAKLFHSSLLSTEHLARPLIDSDIRSESALKYVGLWANQRVNINSAPRHVLEAAFVFGGDAEEIAEEIIQQRRIKPFKDLGQLKESLYRYSDSIGKCTKYITTESDFLTIRVTSRSGVAKATAVVAVMKKDKKFVKVAVRSD
ncbi:MAG: general secretion pathway protein GspK [Planctomycetes bacterium]|nr:general secretion pathway protein GspK [Planctomycetota bacterium]